LDRYFAEKKYIWQSVDLALFHGELAKSIDKRAVLLDLMSRKLPLNFRAVG